MNHEPSNQEVLRLVIIVVVVFIILTIISLILK